ncbi:MAG: DUF3794 domain-containing protein [Oscillospiraceae bacterium]|uniref:DUF3794 domain-containing protein n=1 Tax=Faecousia intestinalis TaxID=3133167 RepID=A0ABV1G4Y4_9FIRM
MELVFQEKQLDYLGRVLDQTVTQELTAEVIVPDSCADADRVVDAFGTLLVRAEECTAGSASVSGEVQAGILFVTEDGRLERLETVIPFSARRGWEGEQSDCRLQCVCRLCSVDARLVHSRKLLVRVGVSCTLTVYAAFTRTLHDFPEPAPTLQLRRKRLPLRLPRGLGEKSFSLNEEIEIPESKPPVERLLKCVYALDTAERKTIGNKAVFKGRLTVHILYESPDGSLQRQETELPFSQFAELEQDLDEGDLTVFLALTSAETEPDGQLDCRRLLLSAGILAQCTVCGEQPVELIEDAYCLDAELKPQWETWEMEGILDVQTFRETAQAAGREPASAIADGWVLAGEPVRRQENGMAKIELPLAANVLFTDPAGKLQGQTLRTNVLLETALAPQADCRVTEITPGELFCAAGADGVTLRCPVQVTLASTARHALKAVCGGTTEPEPEDARRPGVILRRTEHPEQVWDIAKACRTAPETVAAANDLQTDEVPAGTLLLIPM